MIKKIEGFHHRLVFRARNYREKSLEGNLFDTMQGVDSKEHFRRLMDTVS